MADHNFIPDENGTVREKGSIRFKFIFSTFEISKSYIIIPM